MDSEEKVSVPGEVPSSSTDGLEGAELAEPGALAPKPRKALSFKTAASVVMMMTTLQRRATYKLVNADGKLPMKTKLMFAAPQLSVTSLTMLIGIHGTLFYNAVGAKLSFIAFFTALARSFDVLTDPLMAWISDKTRAKMGRRRPYMMFASWVYASMFIFLFSPPQSLSDKGGNGISYWFGLFYVLFYVGDTIANVPYAALGPELTDDYNERSNVFFWQKLIGAIGTLIGAGGPALLLKITGDKLRLSYSILAIFFGIWYMVFMEILAVNIRERPASLEVEQPPLIPSVLRSLNNRAFRPLLLGWILDYVALSAIASMTPFFIKYVVDPSNFDSDSLIGVVLVALMLSGVIAMPFWLWLAGKIGKRNAWLAYNVVNSVTIFFFFFVGKDDIALTLVITVFNGIPLGGQFLIDSILADVIDYDEFLNGTRSEGGFTVFATFLPKIVSIPAQAIPLAIITSVGFRPPTNENDVMVDHEQSQTVKTFIQIVFIVMPFVCTLVSVIVKQQFFPIKKEEISREITKGIEAHMNGESYKDPITGRDVELLVMEGDDQEQTWKLDNFQTKHLRKLVAGEEPVKVLVGGMKRAILYGIISTACAATVLFSTLSFLDNADLSWIPSFSVIITGMSAVSIVFNYMRLRAARQLCVKPAKKELIIRIMEHKGKGQRGGDLMPEEYLKLDSIQAGKEEDGSELTDVKEESKDE